MEPARTEEDRQAIRVSRGGEELAGRRAPRRRRGTLSSPTKQTLREFGDAWLTKTEAGEITAKHKRPYKPSTLRGYRSDLEDYVYDEFGAARLSEIRRRDIQVLVDELRPKLSGQRVRTIIVPLAAIYRYAIRRDLVTVNPTHDLDLPAPGGRREWSASPQDAKKLLDAVPKRDRAIWATALYAGLRRGELRALRVSDLHGLDDEVGDRYVNVERSWDDKAGIVDPKSKAGVRRALMPETLRGLLVEHVRRTRREGDELVFGRTATNSFTPTRIRKRALDARAKAGLPAVTLHQCRHGHDSFLDAAGISEARADRYMGHSSTSIGDRYRHELPRQLRDDAKAQEDYLNREPATVVELRAGAQTGAQPSQTASFSEVAQVS